MPLAETRLPTDVRSELVVGRKPSRFGVSGARSCQSAESRASLVARVTNGIVGRPKAERDALLVYGCTISDAATSRLLSALRNSLEAQRSAKPKLTTGHVSGSLTVALQTGGTIVPPSSSSSAVIRIKRPSSASLPDGRFPNHFNVGLSDLGSAGALTEKGGT